MITALQYLKNHNLLYADVNINEDWIQTWQELDQQLYNGIFDMEENSRSHGETNDMHSSNVMQSSHVNEEVESNSVRA